jgi:outer membrane murein-binding lipoprotein Lpp
VDFLIVEQPYMYPKQCVCGNQIGPMVDTCIERMLGLPLSGFENVPASPVVRVYLCERCVRTAGHVFGMVEHDTHEKLRSDFADLLLKVDTLEGELDTVRPVIEAAREAAKAKAAA